jgi:hypothetical protein
MAGAKYEKKNQEVKNPPKEIHQESGNNQNEQEKTLADLFFSGDEIVWNCCTLLSRIKEGKNS